MIRKFGIIILMTLSIILTACSEKAEISSDEYYKNGYELLSNKSYDDALENFNLALSNGYNDEDGNLKNIISILENYSLANEFYVKNDMEKASEKIYLVKNYENYSIREDVDELKKNIYTKLDNTEREGLRYLDEVLEQEAKNIRANSNISAEEASSKLKANFENEEITVEGVKEFNIVEDNTIWYYFNTYDNEEHEISYYINSKTGEIKENEVVE